LSKKSKDSPRHFVLDLRGLNDKEYAEAFKKAIKKILEITEKEKKEEDLTTE